MPPTRLALLLLAVVAVTACGPANAPATAASVTTSGFALPTASLTTLDGDIVIDTDGLRGRPLVVNFWATWCAPCVEEMPDIEAVHRELGDRVGFLGVDRADVLERARELAERTGVTYTLVSDPDSAFFAAVGARAMPTTLFVDADGAVVHRYAGPLDQARLRVLIADHLGV